MKTSLVISIAALLVSVPAFAQTINDELSDQIQTETLSLDLQFEEVASCTALDSRIKEWIEDHKDMRNKRNYYIMEDAASYGFGVNPARMDVV
ncbi:MAG: hypothetical protein H6766_04345 [Candidatus Peribacteria bacterium]|nr:MAG: hypothetical protein H6766_04345 [Candidatus Peribacteria bacterium]